MTEREVMQATNEEVREAVKRVLARQFASGDEVVYLRPVALMLISWGNKLLEAERGELNLEPASEESQRAFEQMVALYKMGERL